MNSTNAIKCLLTPRQAEERLSISERKLWGLTMPRGDLACVRIARSVRYAVEDLEAFVAKMRTTTDA